MTIALSDNTPRISYSVSESATQTTFAVPFVFFTASTDLNVFVDNTERSFHASTANTTQYTVTGGDGSTGSITTSVTGASGGSTVVITRAVPLSRTTDFPSAGAFEVSKLNTELDTLIAIQSDFNDDTSRAIRLKESDSAVSMELPLLADRKGTVLGFNASTGAAEAGPTIANVNSLSAITANINTVAGIASNVTTVAGISANVTTVAGISSNVTAVAAKASLITSDFVSDLNTLATSDIISDMNTLATSDIVSDLNLLATSDFVSDLNAVEGIKTDVTTVADNISGVNSFAARYRVASSDPSSSLDAGDLAFNTSSNVLKYYNGSSWQAISSITTGISSGNVFVATSGIADNDFLRVDGTSVEGRSASEVASDIGAATEGTATALAIALG